MSLSKDKNQAAPATTAKDPISTHRAYVYGACAPGYGEIYAGARLRGYATLSLFVLFSAWFTWELFVIIRSVVGQVFDSLNGIKPFVLPDLPVVSLAVSFFGIYFLWLWAMLAAVDVAVQQRQKAGQPPQASVGWAVAISWFCPGAGQVYTADRRFGFILWGAYLLGILLMVPAYLQFFSSISEFAKSGQLQPNNPYPVIELIHGLMARVNYSFGKLSQDAVKYVAVAGTLAALRQGPLKTDVKWLQPSMARGIALFGLGWLCPGAGQLLQGRNRIGWAFVAVYVGSKLLIGLLLGRDFITVPTADTLAWLPVLVQWSAMIEAPLAHLYLKRHE
jgi:TM2 domain-containing membrane protein YozV